MFREIGDNYDTELEGCKKVINNNTIRGTLNMYLRISIQIEVITRGHWLLFGFLCDYIIYLPSIV